VTEQELADLERIADAATPGPWRAVAMNGVAGVAAPDHMRCYVYIHGRIDAVSDETVARWQRDAHLIAAARTAVPALIEEVRRLTAERDEARGDVERLGNALTIETRVSLDFQQQRDEALAALKRCEEGRQVDRGEIYKVRDAMIRDGDDSRWQPGETTVDALIRERDEARAEVCRLRHELALSENKRTAWRSCLHCGTTRDEGDYWDEKCRACVRAEKTADFAQHGEDVVTVGDLMGLRRV